jgi:hypothetical protein
MWSNRNVMMTAYNEKKAIGGLSRATWEAEQARMGTFLEPNDLRVISLAYSHLGEAEGAMADVRQGDERLNDAWRTLLDIGGQFATAAERMLPLVWSDAEQGVLKRAP